jgi:hypothetical protein
VLAVLPDTAVTLRLPQVAIAVVTAALVIDVASRCGLGPRRSAFAGILFALGPYYLIAMGVRTMGAYSATLLLGILGIRLALAARDSRRPVVLAGIFGLVCGLAVWENLQAGYLLVPAGLWLLGALRPVLRRAVAAGAAGLVLGASPVIGYVIANGVTSQLLGVGSSANAPSSLADRWQVLADAVLPQFLGLRGVPGNATLAGWFPADLLLLAAIGALGAAAWSHRRDLVLVARGRAWHDARPSTLVLLCLLLAPLLYVTSPQANFPSEPRYLHGLYPVLPVALAALVPSRRAAAAVPVAAALALCLAFTTLKTHDRQVGSGVPPNVARGVVDVMVREHQTRAWGGYFVVTSVQFYGADRVTVSPFVPQRFGERARAVAADPHPAYIVSSADTEVAAKLDTQGVRYRRVSVEHELDVLVDLDPPRQPWQLGLGARPDADR